MNKPIGASALALSLATCVAATPVDPSPSMQRAQALVAQMTLAEKASQLQHDAPAIPRLGVPAYNWWSEGVHGVARADVATVFPQAIGLAATWDTPLVQRVGDVVGTEFRAKFLNTVGADGSSGRYRGLTVWSPNVNIFRDPRWGRGQETYGEDPHLTSRMGVAFIQGLQGPDASRPRVSAAVKHFAVHSGPEADRHNEDVKVSPRDLVDTYLPAFHAAVTWVAPPLEDLPAASLCADAACSRAGLHFERFANLELEGAPSSAALTPQAAFKWGWPDAHDRKESARWTGFLRAGESGEHLLRLKGNRGHRIWIDGELVVDLWDIAWPTNTRGVTLQAGQTYALRVEALQTGWEGEQRLQWSRPGAGDETAVAAARAAHLVVFASGLTWELEGEEMTVLAPGFAGGDRTRIELPAPQMRLLERLAALGRPLVLVNFSGSPMALGAATQKASAIRRVVEAGAAWLWVGGGQPVAAVTGVRAPGQMLKLQVIGRADLPAF